MNSSKKNFIYNASYQILGIITPLITTPYLTRTLGAKGIGNYSYYYSIAYYFFIIIKLGIDNYGNRLIAANRNDRVRIFNELFSMQLINSIVIIVAYLMFLVLTDSYDKTMLFIMIPFILSASLDINWYFYGMELFKVTTIRNIIIKVLTTVSIFLFIGKNEMYKYAIVMTGSALLSSMAMWPVLIKDNGLIKITTKNLLQHIKSSLILFIPVIAISLYKIMDKIMLGALSNTTEVGYYDSAEKIIQIPMALITSLGTVMMPRMSKLYADNNTEEAENIFSKSIEFVMFISSLLSFGIIGLADIFVPWYYGEDFGKCVYLFYIILPSCLFLAFANVVRTQFLIPRGFDNVYIISVISGAIINLIINFSLIGMFQSVGVAIGTLMAEISVCVVQVFSVRKDLKVSKYIKNSMKYVIAGTLMALALNVLSLSRIVIVDILLEATIGTLIYIVILASLAFLYKDRVLMEMIDNTINRMRKWVEK